MEKISNIRYELERRKGRKAEIEKSITTIKTTLTNSKRDLRRHEEAREIVRIAGKATQESLSFHISEITSLALGAVFDDPYELSVEFIHKRNKTECDLMFVRDEKSIKPIDASGGGSVDVASFALRIASWAMGAPKHRNTIILDEPFKNLDNTLIEKGSIMLHEISEKLGIQFIIVTHEQALTEHADKVFEIGIKNRKSYIK